MRLRSVALSVVLGVTVACNHPAIDRGGGDGGAPDLLGAAPDLSDRCADGARDGDETDIDCGGACGLCAAGRSCLVDTDCQSSKCRAARCAPLNFILATPRKLAIATYATGLAAADFNKDGHLDLAVCDYDGVHVVLGHGDGTFGKAASHTAGNGPIHVAAGDFDGDRTLDLAVTNYTGEDVTLLHGRGDGTFTLPGSGTKVGQAPYDGAVADFNRDGFDDLVVANAGEEFVSLLLGGAAGFQPTMQSAPWSSGVSAADFNGDGKADLAAADYSFGEVTILLGDGHGSFNAPDAFSAGAAPTAVASADFDGDGQLDLAVVNQFSDDLSVLLGNGAGGFRTSATIPLSKNPFAVAGGDLNGDGQADVVAADRGDYMTMTDGAVKVLLGKGDGTFGNPRTLTLGHYPFAVVLADFNEDHLLDLVTADSGGPSVYLLLNTSQ